MRDDLFESLFEVLDDDVFVDSSDFVTNGLLADGRRELVVFIDFLFLDSNGSSSNTDSKFFNADATFLVCDLTGFVCDLADNFLVCDLTGFVCDLADDNILAGDLTEDLDLCDKLSPASF